MTDTQTSADLPILPKPKPKKGSPAERATKYQGMMEMRRKAFELRSMGHTFEAIAKALGMPDRRTAFNYCKAYTTNIEKEASEHIKHSLLAEIRRIMATTKDEKTKLACIDRISKLAGLDQQRVDITSGGESLVKFVAVPEDTI